MTTPDQKCGPGEVPRPAPGTHAPVAFPPIVVATPESRVPLYGKLGAVAGGIIALLWVLSRPSCLFTPEPVELVGSQQSEHLALGFTLPEAWMHAPGFDQEEDRKDWEKAWSVYYRGRSAIEFEEQLTIMVLEHDSGDPATDNDARTVGANETIGVAARDRRCQSVFGGSMCTSLFFKMNRRYQAYEYFFVLGKRVVYVRGLFEMLTQRDPDPRREVLPGEHAPFLPPGAEEVTDIVTSLYPLGD